MDELINFARNVARLRRLRGVSKRELAKELRIGRWSMDRLDSGDFPVRLGAQSLFYAARYFGVSVSSLLQDADG